MPTSGRGSSGCVFWWKLRSFSFLKRFCPTAPGRQGLHPLGRLPAIIGFQKASQPGTPTKTPEDSMNTIIYIVGLVVIIGFILSYFGFR